MPKKNDKLRAIQINLRHSPSGILATLCDESLNHVLRQADAIAKW